MQATYWALLLAFASIAFSVLTPVRAQETPVDNQTVPAGAPETLIRIELDRPAKPNPNGEGFKARVLVERVEHLAAFEFTIAYDPKRIAFERVEDQGQFLASSKRGQNVFCPEPVTGTNTVSIVCATLGPPPCLGGLPGASGSGLLASGVFKSKGGGTTVLDLRKTTLVLDDAQPCDPVELGTQSIAHRAEGATVELAGDSAISWIVVGPIIAAVVLILIGGGRAGFRWHRRRAASA